MFSRNFIVAKAQSILPFFLRIHAEGEPEPNKAPATEPEANKAPSINFEDLIGKAREDEKKKLYPRLEKAQKDLETMTANNNANLLLIAEKDSKIKELEKQLADAGKNAPEELIRLRGEVTSLTAAKEELENKLKESDPAIIRQQVTQELEAAYSVKEYRLEKMTTEEGQDILVPELVFGNTKEEIDATFEKAKTRSAEIRAKLGTTGNPAPAPTGRRATPPATNPAVSTEKALDLDALRNLDPRSPEYKQFRESLGLK